MQKGPNGIDLSNEIPPRMFFVFDGLVGVIPPAKVRYASVFRKMGWYDRLLKCYQMDDGALRRLHDLSWRQSWRIDCATFEPDGFCDVLSEEFNRRNLAVSNVYSYGNPLDLARALAYMPEVQYVIHADAQMPFTYGPRGSLGFQGVM